MVCELCAREYVTFRRMNRILRTVNSALRRRIERHKEHSDHVFLALCATDRSAEIALGELWSKGGFVNKCSPQDYNFIVEQCVKTLKQPQKPNSHCHPLDYVCTLQCPAHPDKRKK